MSLIIYTNKQKLSLSLHPSLFIISFIQPFCSQQCRFTLKTRAIKEQGHSKLKTKCDRSKGGNKKKQTSPPPLKIAHLLNSSFKKESGVQRIMSMVCQHTYRHTYIPCSCAQETHQVSVEQTHTVLTGQTRYTHTTHGKRKQETVGHRR